MKKEFLKIISQYSFDKKEGTIIETFIWNDIYTYSMLKTNYIEKNKLAVSIHSVNLRDEILLFIQNGFSEKDSVIITENYISIAESNLLSKNTIDKIQWSEIENINLINHSLIFDLKVGTDRSFDIDKIFSKNKEKSIVFFELLKKLLKSSRGEKENIINQLNSFNKETVFNKNYILVALLGIFGIGYILINQLNKKSSEKGNENSNQYKETSATESIETEKIIVYDTVWSDKAQKDYIKLQNYNLVNVFNEPFEVTMEAHKIAGFISDGGDKIIIPIEIPKNTKYWVYRMNLTNAKLESGEGKLVNEVDSSIKKITFAGKSSKIESETESSLTRELLNSFNAPTKQKPFTNAYFIDNKKDATNFQEGRKFSYDIDNSIKNTHSRKGLIKFNKGQFVYLGLHNDGFDDDIYVTLEVVALIETTKYYKLTEKK